MNKEKCNKMCSQAICEISEGNTSSLTVLYDCLGKDIFVLAISILNSYADAEDAMQETFLKVIQKAGTFDRKGNARAWVLSITRNSAIDMLRKKKATVSIEDIDDMGSESDLISDAEVREMLGKLDIEDRNIVILKLVNGMKFPEISQIMGLTLSATQKRYQRALKKLRALNK